MFLPDFITFLFVRSENLVFARKTLHIFHPTLPYTPIISEPAILPWVGNQ